MDEQRDPIAGCLAALDDLLVKDLPLRQEVRQERADRGLPFVDLGLGEDPALVPFGVVGKRLHRGPDVPAVDRLIRREHDFHVASGHDSKAS